VYPILDVIESFVEGDPPRDVTRSTAPPGSDEMIDKRPQAILE